MTEILDDATRKLLDDKTKDFQRLQKQKAHANGGVEARILTAYAFLDGEQYTDYAGKTLAVEVFDKNKLYLVFNLIQQRANKLLGRLASMNPPFKSRPDRKDPKAFSEAEIVDRMILALDEKLGQPTLTWEMFWHLVTGGVAFEHIPWIPDATVEPVPQFDDFGKELLFKDLLMDDQVVTESQMLEMVTSQGRAPEGFELLEEVQLVGDVGAEILGGLNVFVDQSVKSLRNLAPNQYVYIAKIRSQAWIEDNFGWEAIEGLESDSDLKIVTTTFNQTGPSSGGGILKDLIPLVQGTRSDDDPLMNIVVEGYAPSSKKYPRGKRCIFIPGKRMLHEGDNEYEEIPIVDYHWRPVTTTFWTSGYVNGLIAPQRFINKRLSQLGEQANAGIYSPLLLGPGLDPKDIPTDFPGAVKHGINDQGIPNVQRLDAPNMPSWFLNSLEMVVKLFNDMAGGADLFQENKYPGQLRGPSAVPMLQEILDTEWGPLYNHVGERMSLSKQMRLNRVKQFYPPVRTMHYTDRDQKDEVLVFHTEKILRSGTNFNVTVERGALLPELRALREARVSERLMGPLSILYLDERTGRLDKSKIAADLQFGDEIGRAHV